MNQVPRRWQVEARSISIGAERLTPGKVLVNFDSAASPIIGPRSAIERIYQVRTLMIVELGTVQLAEVA